MGATTVFVLCFLTSLACAVLLWRGYLESRARLLFWSSICFFSFALNNGLLLIDKNTVTDLSLVRTLPVVFGLAALLYGLIWKAEG